jgi:predicted RNase H-like nuclease (RuvC/YqgF family)
VANRKRTVRAIVSRDPVNNTVFPVADQNRGNDDMKDLEERFAEIERRIRPLVAENRSQKKRIRELEKELGQTRYDVQKSAQFDEKQLRLRERIEKILQALESVGVDKS